jgi:hypothetical protein
MDAPDTKTITAMAATMSAEAIVKYYRERGTHLEIVSGDVYPVGIKIGATTLFLAALQPEDKVPFCRL